MKKYVLFGIVLSASFFITWVLCIEYLNLVINGLVPHLSHDAYVNYWFTIFILSEIIVAVAITYVAMKKGVFNK